MSAFRNILLCDDVREELGNKKSLMGVFGGDVVVAEMPAAIHLAVYMEYLRQPTDAEQVKITLRLLQDENEIAAANVVIVEPKEVSTLALPRAVVKFEKDSFFRILAKINDGAEEEILRKQVSKGTIT